MCQSTIEVITNIREIIAEKGLRQKFVAEKSGFTEQAFSQLLTQKKTLKAEYIPKIANALGVTPNDLFRQSESEY